LRIEAAPADMKAIPLTAPVEWLEAAASEDGSPTPQSKRFSMTLYTGGAMDLEGFYHPVVVDLEGMEVPSQRLPSLYAHDPSRIVGHTETITVTAQRLKVSGVISGQGPHVEEILGNASRGFPWQASLGARPIKIERVPAGESATVNGKRFTGPIIIARKSRLKEASFVPLGADDQTSAAIAAVLKERESPMEFNDWLKAKGFDPETLSAEGKETLEAAFNASNKPAKEAETANTATTVDVVAEIRAEAAAEKKRIAAINKVCKEHSEIAAKAIEEGWTETKAELEVLRASRAQGPAIHTSSGPSMDAKVIEAALCQTLKLKNVEKDYKPEVLEAAHRDYRRTSLQQVMLMAAQANGYTCRPGERIHMGNLREVLEYSCPARRIQAGFSVLSLPNILENVANKTLLQGYMEEDQTWREIADVKPVNDFKTHKAYRMLDNMEYEQLGPGGEIKHGSLGEETYSRSAKTYAKMFVLRREDIINDDLGALDDLRVRLGRGAAKKFNNIFWAEFMDNSGLFTSGNTNYISGATTNLGTDGVGLGLAVKAFRKMLSPSADGSKRVGNGMTPTKLLVPPELEGVAETLYRNQNLGSVKSSDANIYANKYRPIVQNRLSDSAFTGYSTAYWYLLGDTLQPMVVSFLNGQESPTVESAEADFSVLGMQFRGYHDFGADLVEYLVGIKSAGA
jgi:hypothetical protein